MYALKFRIDFIQSSGLLEWRAFLYVRVLLTCKSSHLIKVLGRDVLHT